MVMLILVATMTIVFGFANLTTTGLKMERLQSFSTQSHFAAETGLEEAFYKIRNEVLDLEEGFSLTGQLDRSGYEVVYSKQGDEHYFLSSADTLGAVRKFTENFPEIKQEDDEDEDEDEEDPNKKTTSCEGLPENAIWNTASQITQTLIDGNWEPTNIGVYSWWPSTENCYFKCENQNYTWNSTEGKCEVKMIVHGCNPKPNNTEWNIVSKIHTTWTGADWEPTLVPSYNEESSNDECRFVCAYGYVWDEDFDMCVELPKCNSDSITWGNCSAETGEHYYGEEIILSNENAPFSGSITVECDGGTWIKKDAGTCGLTLSDVCDWHGGEYKIIAGDEWTNSSVGGYYCVFPSSSLSCPQYLKVYGYNGIGASRSSHLGCRITYYINSYGVKTRSNTSGCPESSDNFANCSNECSHYGYDSCSFIGKYCTTSAIDPSGWVVGTNRERRSCSRTCRSYKECTAEYDSDGNFSSCSSYIKREWSYKYENLDQVACVLQ